VKNFVIALAIVSFLATQTACSVYKAATQPPPADLQGIGVGTPRQELILKLGAPKFSDTDTQGKKQDTFEFYSGMHGASKARIILYLAGDLFTLCLAEIIFWPMELTVMEKAVCNGFAVYDGNQKVETWKVSQKDGVQDC
jgi:hypothetical protein